MKHDIIISGVGGQGILTIAAIVGRAAVEHGLNVKQSEVHGMAQRGGAVVAHLRLSSNRIYSDLIAAGTADVVLAVEPLEALRHLTHLAPHGALLANAAPVMNITDYPELETVLGGIRQHPRHVLMDADSMAREAGSARAMNMVMLGALSPFLELPEAAFTDMVRRAFLGKGESVVETNLCAFAAGRSAGLPKAVA